MPLPSAHHSTRGMRRAGVDLYELATAPDDPALSNADLAPTKVAQRTWSTYHMAALWVGMAICITTYTLAADLIDARDELVAGEPGRCAREHDRAESR